MVNITQGNDFTLALTFVRGGKEFKFTAVSTVSFVGSAGSKFNQDFDYDGTTVTVHGAHDLPFGTYGIEVVGTEEDALRRTAFPRVLSVSNMTVKGSYEPDDDIDDYDIGIKVKLITDVPKKAAEEEKKDDTNAGTEKDGSEEKTEENSASSDTNAGTEEGNTEKSASEDESTKSNQ